MELTARYNVVSFTYAEKADPDSVTIAVGLPGEDNTVTIPLPEFLEMAAAIGRMVKE